MMGGGGPVAGHVLISEILLQTLNLGRVSVRQLHSYHKTKNAKLEPFPVEYTARVRRGRCTSCSIVVQSSKAVLGNFWLRPPPTTD